MTILKFMKKGYCLFMGNFDKVFQHLKASINLRSHRDLALVLGKPEEVILRARRDGVFPSAWLAIIILVHGADSVKGLNEN
ncbi:MAG: hypothetical protein KAV87_12865 [Desulfobacteraceae bacterium]|nr:hypothetical protein [Desulfobacteraceae bacterium]